MDKQTTELYKTMHLNTNENEIIYYDVNQKIFTSCNIDNMKTRLDYMADIGFRIKNIITLYDNNKAFVRLLIFDPEITTTDIKYLSRVEYALGKINYGISYIIPMNVWEKRGQEVINIFH